MRTRPRLAGVALSLVALALGAAAARGAEGLFLTWNDCALAAAASHDLSWLCDSNAGHHDLYCAFRVSAPVDSVLGFEIVVDVQHADAVLPDWWLLASDGCRYGQLGAGLDFTGHSECADFSLGRATGGVMGYYVTEPRGAGNQARIKVAGAWLPDSGYASLDASSMYYAARIVLANALTVGEGTACTGCAQPACLVLNGMWIRRQPGAPGGDVQLSVPGPDTANWATWQGDGADCSAVPVRAVTWGRLKGLYR
jgi:hypothetical protein